MPNIHIPHMPKINSKAYGWLRLHVALVEHQSKLLEVEKYSQGFGFEVDVTQFGTKDNHNVNVMEF